MVKTVTYLSVGAVVAMLAVGGAVFALHPWDDDKGPKDPESKQYTYVIEYLYPNEVLLLFDELKPVCDTLVVKTGEKDVYYSSFYVENGRMYGFKYNSHIGQVVDSNPVQMKALINQYTGDGVMQVYVNKTWKLVTEISFSSTETPTILPRDSSRTVL